MGVSRNDFNNIATMVFGERVADIYLNQAVVDTPKLTDMIALEDWERDILSPAERTAIRMVRNGYVAVGFFKFDPNDVQRNCDTCKNVTDDGEDCKRRGVGVCHVSIPNGWEARD
jgi:hypothetical protein